LRLAMKNLLRSAPGIDGGAIIILIVKGYSQNI
jgi:hypothetical protein